MTHNGATSALECHDLAKTYTGPPPVVALATATAAFAHGAVTAIMGRSGCGKTTLLTLLGLLDDPTGGTLLVDGQPVPSDSRGRDILRRERFGFVFQAFILVPELTSLANVELALRYAGAPRRSRAQTALAALDVVGLSGRAQAQVRTLSGGEKQRVAIARAIVKGPSVILADEPTGNLDVESEDTVMRLLRGAADAGAAVVVVTHSPTVAGLADRVLLMSDGRLSQQETPIGGDDR